MRFRTAALALLACGLVSSASAQVCDRMIGLRITERGLAFIGQALVPLLPEQLALPAMSQVVVDWPLTDDDAVVHVSPLSARLAIKELALTMEAGALRVRGRAEVAAAGPITLDNAYASVGSVQCNAEVALRDVQLDLALALRVEDQAVRAEVVHVALALTDNEASVIALHDCLLGELLTAVTDSLRSYFLQTVETEAAELLREHLPPLLADQLSGTIQVSQEIAGFSLTARLDQLATDGSGLQALLGAEVALAQPVRPPCLDGIELAAAPGCDGIRAQVPASDSGMFGASVSEVLLNQALHVAWSSGRLCVTSDALPPEAVQQGLTQLAATLGQPAGTELKFYLRTFSPPTLRLSAAEGIQLLLSEVELKLLLLPPGGAISQVLVRAQLALAAQLLLDPQASALFLDINGAQVQALTLQDADGGLAAFQLDPAQLSRFIEHVALPLLEQKLAVTPLSPAVINLLDYLVELKEVSIEEGSLAAAVDVHQLQRSGDTSPPETALIAPPGPLVAPQVLKLQAYGADNQTPSPLLRYQVRVDGGAWSEPRYGSQLRVAVTSTSHLIEVAALDHEDNQDPSPEPLWLQVDAAPPQVIITRRPRSLLEQGEATVHFVGQDDRTPLERLRVSAELLRVPDGGGLPLTERREELAAQAQQVSFRGLADGVYRVRLTVADEAGNVASQDVGFSVSAGGCAVSGGNVSPGAIALALLLGLLCWRQRRSRSLRQG